jgi:hypothetical protein
MSRHTARARSGSDRTSLYDEITSKGLGQAQFNPHQLAARDRCSIAHDLHRHLPSSEVEPAASVEQKAGQVAAVTRSRWKDMTMQRWNMMIIMFQGAGLALQVTSLSLQGRRHELAHA